MAQTNNAIYKEEQAKKAAAIEAAKNVSSNKKGDNRLYSTQN